MNGSELLRSQMQLIPSSQAEKLVLFIKKEMNYVSLVIPVSDNLVTSVKRCQAWHQHSCAPEWAREESEPLETPGE